MGKDIFSKKSRFSIRKLNIGVCSVLLGTLIMIGHTAQADETTSDGATVAATSVSTSKARESWLQLRQAQHQKVQQLLR
nr:YSIRK-type signal peptide-containing protein [Streptococcus salivarius]